MRLIALATLILLTGCSPKQEAEVAEELVLAEEPVAADERSKIACTPGDDDGIGGTGCPVD
jgi:hypothetical protein